MTLINDTCVFIDNISNPSDLLDVARFCNTIGEELCTTNYVLNEITPGLNLRIDYPLSAQKSDDIHNAVSECDKMKILSIHDIDNNDEYNKNYKMIRKRYFQHIEGKRARERMKKKGLTKREIKYKSYRDRGECSCIAVALTDPKNYLIISNDNGRIHAKPDINIFVEFNKSDNINYCKFKEWATQTGYK